LFRMKNGDGNYMRRMVYLLRRSLPEDCSLKWDVNSTSKRLHREHLTITYSIHD
jgi:hypothetical protein